MSKLVAVLLMSLAIVIMICQNVFFGLFNFYMIKEHKTTLQRLLNILYFLLAVVIQVRTRTIIRQHLVTVQEPTPAVCSVGFWTRAGQVSDLRLYCNWFVSDFNLLSVSI